MMSQLARRLSKEVEPSPKATKPIEEYRPISGKRPDWPMPPVRRTYWEGKPGAPRSPEPLVKFLMNMTRREKKRWQRAAKDLGVPLSMLVRLAMRYFMASPRMQRIVRMGPREVEFRKRIHTHSMTRRLNAVIAPPDHESRISEPANLTPKEVSMPEKPWAPKTRWIVPSKPPRP